MFYNPFERVTSEVFRSLLKEGHSHFVLQRLEWPSSTNRWFLLSAYKTNEEAFEHVSQLKENEGKALQMPEALEKISNLIKSGSGYSVFYGRMKNDDWSKHVIRTYQKKIIAYLRDRTNFKRSDHIDIVFTIELGRPLAKISNGEIEKKVPAIELLK